MTENKFDWFDEARFGLFIHWGLSSLLEGNYSVVDSLGGDIVFAGKKMSGEEFARRAERFNPDKFSADAWADHALEAGMRYAVLTSRHHDGFCLWDSQVSDFTMAKTGAKRDFVADFMEGMRRAGLREVGQWLKKHGEGIYGSERIHYNPGKFHTRKRKTLYLYFRWEVHWPSWGREFWLYGVKEPVESAFIPATGQEIEVKWDNGKLCLIGLPKEYPDIMGTVGLRLE